MLYAKKYYVKLSATYDHSNKGTIKSGMIDIPISDPRLQVTLHDIYY